VQTTQIIDHNITLRYYVCQRCLKENPLDEKFIERLNNAYDIYESGPSQNWGMCMLGNAAQLYLDYQNVNNDRWLLVELVDNLPHRQGPFVQFSLHPFNPLDPLDKGDYFKAYAFQYAATPDVQEWLKLCHQEQTAARVRDGGTFQWNGLFRPWNSDNYAGTLGGVYIDGIELVLPKKRSWWENCKIKLLPHFIKVQEGEYPNHRMVWKRLPKYKPSKRNYQK
jgi:hypothetical protein